MARKYIWSKEHNKMMLVGKGGELIDDGIKMTDQEYIAHIGTLSLWRNEKSKSDSFKPHYSPELGYVSTRSEFERKCKEKGLQCYGNEKAPKQSTGHVESKMTDLDIKEMREKDGVVLSDSDANYLKTL